VKVGAVLALDIATTTGWAWHREGMPRPFFGATRLPGKAGAIGEPADALLRFLRETYITLRDSGDPITHFFYEMPFLPQSVNSSTSKRLMGLLAICEMFAHQVGAVGCYEVDIATWRKHFIGRGSGFKKTADKKAYLPGHDPKDLAINRCAQYGWHTDVHDAAEALGILDYSLTLIPDYHRPWRDNALLGGMIT
jgi:hypothetical protein